MAGGESTSRARMLACAVAAAAAGGLAAHALPAAALTTGTTGATGKPQDPSFVAQQWPLRAIGAKKLRLGAQRRLAPVTVATIDTGVALRHADLRARLWRNPSPAPAPTVGGTVPRGAAGWDMLGFDAQPDDTVGHGTAVAGLIGAQIGNGGIDGVAPNARLMAMKACFRPLGGELTCTDAGSAAAIDWAARHGARIIHLSWTLGGGPRVAEQINAHPGVLFVTASGNGAGSNLDSTSVNCTLPFSNLICVAASDRGFGPAPCTSTGPVNVDVAAPGIGLTTTGLGGRYIHDTPCAVSFAGPHVTGLAAILLGAVPRAGPIAIKSAILDGAVRYPAWEGRTVTGAVISVPRSLSLLRSRGGAAS